MMNCALDWNHLLL